jgi:DNA-binding CsgD family transcriptional regulator
MGEAYPIDRSPADEPMLYPPGENAERRHHCEGCKCTGQSNPYRRMLSRRETDIVALVAEGLANKEIAARLGITEGTAKIYLFRVYQKTGFNRVQVALAYVAGEFEKPIKDMRLGPRAIPSHMPPTPPEPDNPLTVKQLQESAAGRAKPRRDNLIRLAREAGLVA